ncbi:unnamed protein product [Dracunculus medinensis]|uniref:Large ribosomal subunit protein bL9m n=1 Tax=Dracunculus medinensis TaxID=318479 RepID=A0A0N4UQ47_DRAME|nr:unnamed protein product [Dracunculus medinensis]
MTSSLPSLFVNITKRAFINNQRRNTWILRHVIPPPSTPTGSHQRRPDELQDFMKYEVVDYENKYPAGPLKVILLEDVEGIGNQFDVVEVNRKLARLDLLLTRKATYASPFDLEYYGKLREQMKDELEKRVRIPYEYIVIGKELMSKVIALRVSIDQPWTLDRDITKLSLLLAGIRITDNMIFLDGDPISGPNLELEGAFLRFYVVINNQYVVPMIGRISHVSADKDFQVLQPESSFIPNESDLKRCGIMPEKPYFNRTPDLGPNTDIVQIMKTFREEAK